MSFYDPEKNHNFILSPREISFINKNIRKQNNLIKKRLSTTIYEDGSKIPVEDDYISLSSDHPDYPYYSHINDIYCFKVYTAKEIILFNIKNKTTFCPLFGAERPLRKVVHHKRIYPKYDEEGNKISFTLIPKQNKAILA